MRTTSFTSVLTTLLLALLVAGCSSFNRKWKQAALAPVPADSIEGRWNGRWLSAANGHHGALRCIVAHTSNDVYSARFHATYMKVLHFGYTVPLTVARTNEVWHFHGAANLGAFAGGVYRYDGTATSARFHSTYDSKFDHGDFEMTRPPAEPAPPR